MRNTARLTALACLAVFSFRPSHAQGVHATGAIPGYKCALLNISEQALMDPHSVVPINASPSPTSPIVGQAASIVFLASPEVEVAGYMRVLRFDGGVGWIDSRYVTPWHPPGTQPYRCTPAYLSNGHIGPLVK